MDYKEATEYLYRQLPMFSRTGGAAYKPGLDTSLALDEYFGHPHRKYKTIHVGGTNGKGSTSHLLAAILQAQGYRTGLYTSPHLVDFRERIRVDGEPIPEEAVADFTQRFISSGYEGHPSFFELTMMMAFEWFARAEVDIAVIEVGMGGRLDSTNIITPEACVITNISWDHTQFLGDTLEKIAAEKAGIIKPGIPVTIGEAGGEIRKVFEEAARKAGAPVHFAEDIHMLENADVRPEGGIDCRSPWPGEFYCSLSGDYQKKNINTVLCAVKMLGNVGIDLYPGSVIQGMKDVERSTGLRGRWTRLGESPLAICDTGHNEGGLRYNMSQLKRIMDSRPGSTLHIVMGFVADKAVDEILGLFPADARYYLTQAAIPRAMKVEELEARATRVGLRGSIYASVSDAWEAALKEAGPDDVIYVGGSTFIVADLLSYLGR